MRASSQNGFLNILRDRSKLQGEAERRDLLAAEMNHRVKNTFAVVQAIAARTGRYAATSQDFQVAFASRLAALAHSHDLLIKGKWEDAPLRDLVEGALTTYSSEPGRITIDGTSVRVAENLVVGLTLAFHELATNAAKHGSLSVSSGSVHVSWLIKPTVEGGRRIELLWRERGGPPVVRPERQGFGSHILKNGLGYYGGSLHMEFQPAGVECHICLPLGINT